MNTSKIVTRNQFQILVGPPAIHPVYGACEQVQTGMKPKTKSSPLIVLVLAPCIVNACRPVTVSFEYTLFVLGNSSQFDDFEEIIDQFSETEHEAEKMYGKNQHT